MSITATGPPALDTVRAEIVDALRLAGDLIHMDDITVDEVSGVAIVSLRLHPMLPADRAQVEHWVYLQLARVEVAHRDDSLVVLATYAPPGAGPEG